MPSRYRTNPPNLGDARAHLAVRRDPFPQEPALLRMIVWGLVERIRVRDGNEAKTLTTIINNLAAHEQRGRWGSEAQTLMQRYAENATDLGWKPDLADATTLKRSCHAISYFAHMMELIHAKGETHSLRALVMGRDLLNAYFKQHRYPPETWNSDGTLWLEKHVGTLVHLASSYPCPCTINLPPEQMQVRSQDAIKELRRVFTPTKRFTPRDAILRILGTVHAQAPSAIQKALTRKSPILK